MCIVNGASAVVVSRNFTGELLEEECHDHFMEDVFEESCETSTQEATTKPEAKRPSAAQRTCDAISPSTNSIVESHSLGYGYGFLAVSIVSALSIVGLLAFPFMEKTLFQYILAAFTALAVGTLFGDAMFHLIPFVRSARSAIIVLTVSEMGYFSLADIRPSYSWERKWRRP